MTTTADHAAPTLDVAELIRTRTTISLAELAVLEGTTTRALYRKRRDGTLGYRTEQAGPRAEVRVPISEVRRRFYGQ